ncbi:MAG: hypothetical protein WAV15_02135 [Minisyncoccia bacterium]
MPLSCLRFSKFFLLLAFSLTLGLSPLDAGAVSPSSILVNVSPQSPAPGESVTISLNSYASNLDSVLITWSVNGKSFASEIGKKSFSVSAPDAGTETRIVATVALPDGSIDRVITIRPIVMTLLWQANDSYVPPFYKGKALPATDSEVKVVAIPEIKNGAQIVNSKNLVYAWKKDYTNDPTASGYGKNFYIYINDYLEDSNNISVTASTTDQKNSSQGNLNIKTFEPKILFYKNDPKIGTIWEHALSNGHRILGEEVLEAVPYFISPRDIRIPSLTWIWSINNTSVTVPGSRRNLLPLQTQIGTTGTSKVSLEISHKYKLLSGTKKEITLEF